MVPESGALCKLCHELLRRRLFEQELIPLHAIATHLYLARVLDQIEVFFRRLIARIIRQSIVQNFDRRIALFFL